MYILTMGQDQGFKVASEEPETHSNYCSQPEIYADRRAMLLCYKVAKKLQLFGHCVSFEIEEPANYISLISSYWRCRRPRCSGSNHIIDFSDRLAGCLISSVELQQPFIKVVIRKSKLAEGRTKSGM